MSSSTLFEQTGRLRKRFANLGNQFFAPVKPLPLQSQPVMVAINQQLTNRLNICSNTLHEQEHVNALSGCNHFTAYQAIASVYAGHQFGHYVKQLGDGRALLVAEVEDTENCIQEIQLKGAGPTVFSRMGDGRAVLRSSIREYLCSIAMTGLGIPTTSVLCLTASSDPVFRETTETAAIVTRVAPSFIRFGHFEYFCYTNQYSALEKLTNFVINHYYPQCQHESFPVLALLEQVVIRTAKLLAAWQCVGFCHGVMNTDNMSILGLTLDYGPFGFLDQFNSNHICNHSDEQGRYSYQNQPSVAHWNLYALAQALSPLMQNIEVELIKSKLDNFWTYFEQEYQEKMAAKLGFLKYDPILWPLFKETWSLLEQQHQDMTRFFRDLAFLPDNLNEKEQHRPHPDEIVRNHFIDREVFDIWAKNWRSLLAQLNPPNFCRANLQNLHNPNIILRNHLAQTAIEQAQNGNFSEILLLENALGNPYQRNNSHQNYEFFPPDWAQQIVLSCSS